MLYDDVMMLHPCRSSKLLHIIIDCSFILEYPFRFVSNLRILNSLLRTLFTLNKIKFSYEMVEPKQFQNPFSILTIRDVVKAWKLTSYVHAIIDGSFVA